MVKKIFLSIFSLAFFAFLSSCSSELSNDDDDFRTIPVTNNPLIVPDAGSPMPGIPSGSSSPR